MPEFCRHGRFIQSCRICSPPAAAPERPGRAAGSSEPARAKSSPATRRCSGGLVVKRAPRAADDGYSSELVPGLHASGDARRLAGELAFSIARLGELATDPPGLYADVAGADDHEEGTWLAFLVTYLGPAQEAPFAAAAAARTSWASGELPDLSQAPTGPRGAHARGRGDETLRAYRAWAERQGGQVAAFTGDAAWAPERRFDRVFERLSLPGFPRAGRFELLVVLGRLGLYDLRPTSLRFDDDAVTVAAKRVFGIGERVLLERRAATLAEEAGIPVAALDLALFNFGQPEGERATMGSRVEADPAERERIEAALQL